MAGHELVVPGQHLHGDAGCRHRLNRFASAGFRRIEENGKAGENQTGFIGDRGGLVARID